MAWWNCHLHTEYPAMCVYKSKHKTDSCKVCDHYGLHEFSEGCNIKCGRSKMICQAYPHKVPCKDRPLHVEGSTVQ